MMKALILFGDDGSLLSFGFRVPLVVIVLVPAPTKRSRGVNSEAEEGWVTRGRPDCHVPSKFDHPLCWVSLGF